MGGVGGVYGPNVDMIRGPDHVRKTQRNEGRGNKEERREFLRDVCDRKERIPL